MNDDLDLSELRRNWESMARDDAYWAVLSDPSKAEGGWRDDEFWETGRDHMRHFLGLLKQNDIAINSGLALDFGCGVGRLTQPLAAAFERVVGLDISTAMIEKARAANPPANIDYVHSESARLPFEDNHFDFLLAHLVLLHVGPEAAEAYVEEFARVLAPGGLGIISLPSSSDGRAERRVSFMPVKTADGVVEQQYLIVPVDEMVGGLEILGLKVELQFCEGDPAVQEFGIYVFRKP